MHGYIVTVSHCPTSGTFFVCSCSRRSGRQAHLPKLGCPPASLCSSWATSCFLTALRSAQYFLLIIVVPFLCGGDAVLSGSSVQQSSYDLSWTCSMYAAFSGASFRALQRQVVHLPSLYSSQNSGGVLARKETVVQCSSVTSISQVVAGAIATYS